MGRCVAKSAANIYDVELCSKSQHLSTIVAKISILDIYGSSRYTTKILHVLDTNKDH